MSTTNKSEPLDDTPEEDVEIFLSRGSFKPMILPPLEPMSSAKRRWKLLKNVAFAARRRSSLTVPEELLLEAINKSHKTTTSSNSSSSDTTAQRTRLRASITSKVSVLTNAEQAFLNRLAGNENVSDDHLAHVSQVLAKDPLYTKDSISSVEEQKPERPTLSSTQDKPSFRRETWTQYMSTTSLQSNQDIENDKEEKKVEHLPKATKKLSIIDRLFRKKREEKKVPELEEVSEEEEVTPPLCILATSVNDEACHPHVLSPPMMDALRPHMPFCVQQDNFWLKYSMIRDGASMRALLRSVRASARTVIAIETMDGDVFGSFTSSPWRPNGRAYYGSGEAFIWRLAKSRFTPCDTVEQQIELESDIDVFPWTGQNRNVQSLAHEESQLILGGGGPDEDPFQQREDAGSALTIDPNLTRGTSDKSLTFNNPPLPTTEQDVFEIANIEVWTLTPVEQLDQAEQLELGRQFVFDHGNFIEA